MSNKETTETVENVETTENKNTFEPMHYLTFDNNDPKNRVRIFNAHNTAVSLKNIGDTPIKVVDVMAEPGKRARSENTCQNTYLFTEDGKVYFTQSNGIAKTTNELVEMVQGDFHKNTTNGYVQVKLTESKLNGDRSYKQLQLLEA